MKRADLKVGQAYWYSRGNDWLEREGAGQKCVVVDTGCWALPNYSMWSRDKEPHRANSGNGVLVDLANKSFDGKTETVRRTVVNLTQIRGPYEETLQQVKEFDAKRRARNEEKQAKSDLLTMQISQVIAQAAELGVKAHRGSWQSDEIVLTRAELAKLIDMVQDRD